jgi:probable 2-oxoglutarate dehydrogenase E1 component DHKTD1
LLANLDPLSMHVKDDMIESLQPKSYGLSSTGKYNVDGILGGLKSPATIDEIVEHLKRVYSSTIALEFHHLPSQIERRWFSNRVETDRSLLEKEEKLKIHSLLSKSEVFDQFMSSKFPQVKRYGLEGAESMMVLLDFLFKSSSQGTLLRLH